MEGQAFQPTTFSHTHLVPDHFQKILFGTDCSLLHCIEEFCFVNCELTEPIQSCQMSQIWQIYPCNFF